MRCYDGSGGGGENGTAARPTGPARRDPVWVSRNIIDQGQIWHMNKMPGVNEAMGYIGCLCTFFSFNVEDDGVESMSYMHKGAPKVWYVFPPDQPHPPDEFLSRNIYNASF